MPNKISIFKFCIEKIGFCNAMRILILKYEDFILHKWSMRNAQYAFNNGKKVFFFSEAGIFE